MVDKRKKWNINKVRQLVESLGGTLLSKEYINYESKKVVWFLISGK